MIDIGDSFDYAIQSLALSLNLPHSLGGTFQNFATADFLDGQGNPCLACINDFTLDNEILEKLSVSKIQSITDISFLPSMFHPFSTFYLIAQISLFTCIEDKNPVGQSTFLVANQCANLVSLVIDIVVIDY